MNLYTRYARQLPSLQYEEGAYCFLTDRDIVDGLIQRRMEDYWVLLTRKWCMPVGGR